MPKHVKDPALHATATIDQTVVLARVRAIEDDLSATEKKVKDLSIEDDEDYNVACALLIQVVEQRKYIEEQREGFLEDVKRLRARVEGWFADAFARVDKLEPHFRKAVADYALTLDAKAHSLRLAATKMKSEAKAEALLREANETTPPKFAGVVVTPKAKVEITNEAKLPDWAWKRVVDMKAIEAAIDRGETVPGAKHITEMSVRVTPKHAKGREA